MLKSCEIDFNNPPAKAQVIISAGDVPLGTQGNLFGITGGEGTGKSNYVAAIVSGCVCPMDVEIDTLGIHVRPTEGARRSCFMTPNNRKCNCSRT